MIIDDGQEESRRSTATIDSIKRLQRGIDMIPSPKSPQGQGAAMEVNPTRPRTRSQGPSNEDAATALMSLIVHALRGDQHHTEDEDIAEPSKTAWKVCIHANEATKAPAGRGPRTHGNGGPDRMDARTRAMHEDGRTTRAARMISKARSAHMGEGRDQHNARVTNGTARVKTQQVISTFNPVHNYDVPSTQVIHPVLSTQDIFPVSSTQETPHHNSTE